jgi:hypothetical protein
MGRAPADERITMLLRRTAEGMIAITQPAHAWLSGLMAQAWGAEGFARPEPFQEVCLAAALHDIGWLDWEGAPRLDPKTGWPMEFWDVPATIHTAFWAQGVDHVGALSLYAATLVSLHGEGIYDRTFDSATAKPDAVAAVEAFRAGQQAFQRRALAAMARDPHLAPACADEALRFNKDLVATVDVLSLNIGWGVDKPVTIDTVPLSRDTRGRLTLLSGGADAIVVDPWPFRVESLALAMEGRLMRERHETQAAFAAAFAEAPLVTITTTLRPKISRDRAS